jgi:NAD-dependent protein deacetylase/lipoamidase
MPDDITRARAVLAASRHVVVLTGAGISTDSGVADFRGPNGVWTKDPEAERAAHIDVYLSDPEVRRRSWQNRLHSPIWDARPNAGHRALLVLEESGRLDLLVTQNIDGLHHKAGHSPDLIVEIHGTALAIECLRCGERQPSGPVHERVRSGELDPSCQALRADGTLCGGVLKSATISFGQSLVARDLQRAEAAAASCEVLLALGSTLGVYPAAGLVPIAVRNGAKVLIVNGGPTELDALADVVVHGSLSDVLPMMLDFSAEENGGVRR